MFLTSFDAAIDEGDRREGEGESVNSHNEVGASLFATLANELIELEPKAEAAIRKAGPDAEAARRSKLAGRASREKENEVGA